MGASLSWCGFQCDSIRIGLSLIHKEPIQNRFFFALPGSYKFYDTYEPDYQKEMELVGITLDYSPSLNWGVVVSLVGSEYFYVNGRHGDDRQTRLCGEFDVLLGQHFLSGREPVRVTGDYSLLFTNYNPR
jgi:hypothetical protein